MEQRQSITRYSNRGISYKESYRIWQALVFNTDLVLALAYSFHFPLWNAFTCAVINLKYDRLVENG
jgi:hypothetical protein